MSSGYISGLTQSDGSFFCSIVLSPNHLFGLQFRPKFTITADLDSKKVLESVQHYFGCGRINIDLKNHTANYVVTSIQSFVDIIISQFDKYPLFCYKLHAFNLLKLIVYDLLNNKKINKNHFN